MAGDDLVKQVADRVREAIDLAEKRATEIVEQAQSEAERIRSEAEQAATRLRGDAEAQAQHRLEEVRREHAVHETRALKERQIAWAATNGLRELVAWTQTGNENMQAVNAKLGYELRDSSVVFARQLPIR